MGKSKAQGSKSSATKMHIYEKTVAFLLSNGYSPTVRELCDITGLKSTSTVKLYLDELAVEGLITMRSDSPRTICVKGLRLVDERETTKKLRGID